MLKDMMVALQLDQMKDTLLLAVVAAVVSHPVPECHSKSSSDASEHACEAYFLTRRTSSGVDAADIPGLHAHPLPLKPDDAKV